jgi:hypothetical protein
MRVVAIIVAALGLATAAGGATQRISSGLQGVVTRPMPVCVDDPCEQPAAWVVLQFRRMPLLSPVAQVKTNAAGMYKVRLAVGPYSVTTVHRMVGTGLAPRVVRVPRGRLARVDFHLRDTRMQ